MFKPRSIQEIHQQVLQAVLQQNTTLNDVAQGSALYTLTRAFAAGQSQQDLAMFELAESFYIATAKDYYLDKRAGDYGLTRRPGGAATGEVLVSTYDDSFSVEPGIILTEPLSTLQFQVTEPTATSISVATETTVSVRCTQVGERANLPAGIRLISPTYPQGNFVVGTHRTSAGVICGGLTGGVNIETDEQLRVRLTKSIINSRGTTEQALSNVLLAESTVPWVALLTPRAGYIQVWVDNSNILSSNELQRLTQIANTAKPAGTLLSVHQAARTLTEINVFVQPGLNVNLQDLTDKVVFAVGQYLLGLKLGEPLLLSNLIKQVLAIKGVLDAQILEPRQTLAPSQYGVVRSSRVRVTYEAH